MTCRLSTALLTGKPFPLVVLLHLDSVWDRLLKLHCENESLDLVGKQTERSSKGLPWVSQAFWPIPPRCSHVFRSSSNDLDNQLGQCGPCFTWFHSGVPFQQQRRRPPSLLVTPLAVIPGYLKIPPWWLSGWALLCNPLRCFRLLTSKSKPESGVPADTYTAPHIPRLL